MAKEKIYANLEDNVIIQDNVIIGLKYKKECKKTRIGKNSIIRTGSIIYADVEIGNSFKTGHNVLIREKTKIGNNVVIGTGSVIDGNVKIGSNIKIESCVYIPTHTRIGNNVFIGPMAVLTNDKYPLRIRKNYKPKGPVIKDNVTIGANTTILPGVKIGRGSFIAAGAIVTKDVPEWKLVVGTGKIIELPEKLKEVNKARDW